MLVLFHFFASNEIFFFTEYFAQQKRNTICSSTGAIYIIMPDASTCTLNARPKTTLKRCSSFEVTETAENRSTKIVKAALRRKSNECASKASSTSDKSAVPKLLKLVHTSGSRWNAVVTIQRWYRKRCEGFHATRLLGIFRLLQVEERGNFLLPEMQETAAEILNTNWLNFCFACIDCVLQAGELYDYLLRRENQIRFYMVQELETTDCGWKEIDKLQRRRQRESCASLRRLYVLPDSIWVEEVSTVVTSHFSAALKGLAESGKKDESNQGGDHINVVLEEKNAESDFYEMLQQVRMTLKEKNTEWLMSRVHHCYSRGCQWSRFHHYSGCSALNDDKESSLCYSRFAYQKPLHFVLQLLSNLSCPQYIEKTLSFISDSIQCMRKENSFSHPPVFCALKTEEIVQEEEAPLHRLSSVTSSSFTVRDDSPIAMKEKIYSMDASHFDPHQLHHEKQLQNDSCVASSLSLLCDSAPRKGDSSEGLTVPQHDLTSATETQRLCEPVELRHFEISFEADVEGAQDCLTPERFSQTQQESESNSDSMDELLLDDEENFETNEEVIGSFDSVEDRRCAQLNKTYFSSQEKRRMEVFSQIEQEMKFHPSAAAETQKNKGCTEFDTYDGEQVKEGIDQFGELKGDLQLIGFRNIEGGGCVGRYKADFFLNSFETRDIAFSPCTSTSLSYCVICEMEGFVFPSVKKTVKNGEADDGDAFFSSSVQEIVESRKLEKMEPCHGCKRLVHLDCGVRYTEKGKEREIVGHNLLFCCSACLSLEKKSSRAPLF